MSNVTLSGGTHNILLRDSGNGLYIGDGADVTVGFYPKSLNAHIYVDVNGDDKLVINSNYNGGINTPSAILVNLEAHSNLTTTDTMSFGKYSVVGPNATDTLAGDTTFIGTHVFLDTNLAGSGSITIHPILTPAHQFMTVPNQPVDSALEIAGSVGSGVAIHLGGEQYWTHPGKSTLTIDHPKTFHGSVSFNILFDQQNVDLVGIKATSYDTHNGALELFNGNKLVESLRLTNNSGKVRQATGMENISVEQNSLGVVLSTHDATQPGGIGSNIPLISHH